MTSKLIGPVAAALLACPCFSQQLQFEPVKKEVLQSRLEAGRVANKARRAAISALFADAGCTSSDQPVGKRNGNVICTLPGQTAGTIIVGGHLDFVEVGEGIVDDWSGASLLPTLYESLKSAPRRHTFVFVAFDKEEDGLDGSRLYVKQMTAEQRSATRAFMNLECLGLGDTNVWVTRSDRTLVESFGAVASSAKIPVHAVNVDYVGDDDTHPFLDAHIPVISVHSVTTETFPILHSRRDRLDRIHLDAYYQSYRLIAFYLAYLDQKAN